MKKFISTFTLFILLSANGQTGKVGHVLFIYDNLKDSNKIYIDAIRNKLDAAGVSYTECDLKKSRKDDIDILDYANILIYSEVRAFKIRRPLRKWLSRTGSFKGKKVGAFVTGVTDKFSYRAATTFKRIITYKDGEVIDAVSSATKKMSDQLKKEKAGKFAAKFLVFLE